MGSRPRSSSRTRSLRDSRPRILERHVLCKACPAFRAAVTVHDDAQLLLAFHPYRHVPQRQATAVVDVYRTSTYRTACRLCPPTTLKQKHRFRPFRIHRVCFAFVPLTFDLDCDILFSEHVMTSSLFVSPLQLEVFHAPSVYLVSVNPTTFREEPKRFFTESCGIRAKREAERDSG